MFRAMRSLAALSFLAWLSACTATGPGAALQVAEPRAFVDGRGPGFRRLSLQDFDNVNGDSTTWTEVDGMIRCTGKPLGGARSKKVYRNFELVAEWKHHTHGGNSGIFVWCPASAFTDLPQGTLPRSGIEVQVLDLGYEQQWLAAKGAHSDWFTSHGDVFPVGDSTMVAFTPSMARSDCGSTAKKCAAARSARRARATWRSSPKARRSSTATCGCANCPERLARGSPCRSDLGTTDGAA